ncbi:polysaccharide biosynthesis tyrosine autokinase [Aetokthonos hydrillicola Thurmond2011]|jgi:capsular exopolysaccharide synthesis family protein|uniref:non-specific protein-tyrosine kinase n=1 Tax=Aetokthonos hydrillicola Thurmond2011 TaxID=2712845 RepID=A0AAP5I720_9CYAN|nr:polysaccharide biosynthesis tyrosine autokinase [Aetokthonos hydrillicola]MBO3460062.1 polysaccharide biosynthesis tyrosine autokinase [Aetokthonos hydrillicola CCALA 1050]MBW4589539.1 polysaccharide biosynthesis tyrosine autokinase [Aetokthonos hydrillicola CCALA 1050]MDR9896036.1 polysaccharide biosynthesis tyrosine autokinase [Aetokthonos hydrillicola Thurmond2011]
METQPPVVNFDKYWHLLKRHGLSALGIFIHIFVISLFLLSLKRPSYEAEGKLSFQRNNTISSLTGVGTEIGKLEPLVHDKSNPVNTEAEIIRSIPVVQKTINKLKLQNDKGETLKSKEFLKHLTIKEVKGSDVLQVSYRDSNPQTSADVVNTLMHIYLEQNISFYRVEVAAARKFIEKQLPTAETVVRKADAELRRFKEKNQIVVLPEEATKGVEMIADLEKKISDTQSRIADVNAQSQSIRKQLKMNSPQAITMTSLSQSEGVQDILKEIQHLESQITAKKTVLQDKHPEIIKLKTQLAGLRELQKNRISEVVGSPHSKVKGNLQIGELQQTLSAKLAELESTRLGLVSEVSTLSKLEADYKQRLKRLPQLEQQQRELERKLQAAQSTYSMLLQKLQESRIAENQNVGNARIISAAQVPEDPVSSPIVIFLSAGLIATLGALATIYILEVTDKSVKTIDEAKELLGMTLLGVIPSFSKSQKSTQHNEESESDSPKLIMRDTPCSPSSEAYRMLRANLKFIRADKKLKVIVITSSVPKEGKSTVAANLAIAMAQMESKVLLVDGDLYSPVQHHIWELPNAKGLSNVIVGQAEITTAVKKVMDSLDVLTAGVLPPCPGSLLDSKRMATLIENFTDNYDFVIVDAPSLNVAADAATLGQMADGVLFIVRPGVVNSVDATSARELLEKSGQNVLGQVVNGVISQKKSRSYYMKEEYYQQKRADLMNNVTEKQDRLDGVEEAGNVCSSTMDFLPAKDLPM